MQAGKRSSARGSFPRMGQKGVLEPRHPNGIMRNGCGIHIWYKLHIYIYVCIYIYVYVYIYILLFSMNITIIVAMVMIMIAALLCTVYGKCT